MRLFTIPCGIFHCRSFGAIQLWVLSLLFFASAVPPFSERAFAQQDKFATQTTTSVQLSADVGLGGSWKVGTPTRVVVTVASDRPISGRLEADAIDGDGVPVRYESDQWQVALASPGEARKEIYLQSGRAKSPLTIRFIGQDGTKAESQLLTSTEGTQGLPALQPWVVSIGGDLQLDEMGYRAVAGTLPTYSTSVIEQAAWLPGSSLGYSGINLLAISTVQSDWLNQLSSSQQNAISHWVRQGGRLFVCVGNNADVVRRTEWLNALLPGPIVESLEGVDPGPVESYAGSEKPLPKLRCAKIDSKQAIVDLTALSRNREPFALVSRRAIGFGQVMLVSVDLDSKEFLEWPDRGPLMSKLIGDHWQKTRDGMMAVESISAVGYSDLSGQLRATLDVFDDVQTADISLLAALLVVFLLVIGPIDYFLWVRKWKLAKITWWTLSIASIFSCIGIAWMNQRWKPIEPRLNEVTLWDFDSSTEQVRARSWFHLYSGTRSKYQLKGKVQPLGQSNAEAEEIRIDWQGVPGSGLGGFDSTVTTDRGMPGYQVKMVLDSRLGDGAFQREDADSLETTRQSFETWRSSIEGVGIPVAGTKAFQAEWSVPWYLANDPSNLKLVSGTDLLEGRWTNPLPVDLRDAVAMYKNWAYALPTRLPPGQSVEFSLSSTPKDLARRLQKRRIVEGNEQGSPWEPANRSEVDRLMDMILFHKAAGGEGYTTLSHQLYGDCDLSELLRLDRAIVVGRVDHPTWTLDAQRDGDEAEVQDSMRRTWVRFVIPITR